MLGKYNKIKLRASRDFFQRSVRMRCGGANLYYQQDTDHFRASVVIAKKTTPLASQRAKIKRHIYWVIQGLLPQIKKWQISVVVVIVNPEKISAEYHFAEELQRCLSEIHQKNEKNYH